jgi:Fe2+ transport system protein B
MAIGLGLAYGIVVEGIIFNILGNLGGNTVRQIESWFPFANTGYLSASFGAAVPPALARTISKPIADANHAVLVLSLYVVIFLVGSALLVKSRDVSS